MKKFSKEIEARRQEVLLKLVEAEGTIEQEIEALNSAVVERVEAVNAAIADYNEILSDANGLQSDAVAEIDGYIQEKTEKWQEGERGQKYVEWSEAIDNLCFDEISFDEPSQVDCPEFGAKTVLEEEWQEELPD